MHKMMHFGVERVYVYKFKGYEVYFGDGKLIIVWGLLYYMRKSQPFLIFISSL